MPWTTSTRHARLPSDWRRRRQQVLSRDHGICYVCHTSGADEVDHVTPNDDHSLDNLAAIHSSPCHRTKTQHEAAAARGVQVAAKHPTETHPGLR